MLAQLSKHFNTSPEKISVSQVKEYLYYCREQRGLSNAFINQTISALKILRQDVLGLEWDKKLKIKRPRRHHHLPTILSKSEVNNLVEVTANPKHKAIIATLYSTGVRLSELLHLKLNDIDSTRMVIRITNGKGNKSRDTMLAEKTLKLLRDYYSSAYPKPSIYLFEGRSNPGKPYSSTSVRRVVKRAAAKAGIKKSISPHSLRHAFATHLLEQGVNIKMIQKLLGHGSMRATSIYLHLAKLDASVKSPFDRP
jgi:site-specific recombinase XerD